MIVTNLYRTSFSVEASSVRVILICPSNFPFAIFTHFTIAWVRDVNDSVYRKTDEGTLKSGDDKQLIFTVYSELFFFQVGLRYCFHVYFKKLSTHYR